VWAVQQLHASREKDANGERNLTPTASVNGLENPLGLAWAWSRWGPCSAVWALVESRRTLVRLSADRKPGSMGTSSFRAGEYQTTPHDTSR